MDRFIDEMRYKLASLLSRMSRAVNPPSAFGFNLYEPPVQRAGRVVYLGFASGWVQPGCSEDVRVHTSFESRLVGAMVGGTARYFQVESVKVGRDEQLYGDEGVPAVILPSALYRRFEDARLWPCSLYASVRIQNIGKRPHRLRGALVVQLPKSAT